MLGILAAQTIRFPITPAASLVVADCYFPLALAPAAFWDAVRSDGGDVRVTTQDGTTQCPREIVGFDYANKTGSLFFAPGSGTAFYVCAGSGEPEPSADASIGKYNVWESSLIGVWHLQDLNDSTRSEKHGSAVGSLSSITGKIGGGKACAADAYMNTAASMLGLQHATIFFWGRRAAAATKTAVGCSTGTADRAEILTYSNGNLYIEIGGNDSIYGWIANAPYGAEWYNMCLAYDGTQATNDLKAKLYVAGVLQTLSWSGTIASSITCASGVTANYRHSHCGAADYDEIRLYNRTLGATEIAQLYSNQNNPAGFWTVGAAQ